jgi:hypothetical protein
VYSTTCSADNRCIPLLCNTGYVLVGEVCQPAVSVDWTLDVDHAVLAIDTDADNNLYVLFDADGGLVSYTVDGSVRWSMASTARALDMGADGYLYLVGPSFVSKHTAAGALVWSQSLGGANPRGVAVGASGTVFVTGALGTNVFAASLTSSGGLRWSQIFSPNNLHAPYDHTGRGIAVDDRDHAYIVGQYYGDGIDFGGGVLAGPRQASVFVVHFASDGTHRWSTLLPLRGKAAAIAVGATGEVYATAILDVLPTRVYASLFLHAFDGELGTELWPPKVVAFGSSDNSVTHADAQGGEIAIDSLGNVYVSGTNATVYTRFTVFDSDVHSYSADGGWRWSQSNGSSGGPVAVDTLANVTAARASPLPNRLVRWIQHSY